MARRRVGPRRGDAHLPGGAAGRRRDLGAAHPSRGAPSAATTRRGPWRPPWPADSGCRLDRLLAKDRGRRVAGSQGRRRPPHGRAGSVRLHAVGATPGPAGRRRPDHRRHGGGVRAGAHERRRAGGPPAGRGAVVPRPRRVAPGRPGRLSSGGPSSGSVVARGSSPVVDASRGRNDPRKATLGGRAWRGLDVSPAPASAGRGWSRSRRGRQARRRAPRRRVWGQRPGQPDEGPSFDRRGSRRDAADVHRARASRSPRRSAPRPSTSSPSSSASSPASPRSSSN